MSVPGFSEALHEAVATVCPIIGVRIGTPDDRSTWQIEFADRATQEQRAAAAAALDDFAGPRRLVPKSVIIARLSDGQLAGALAAMTARQKERWRAPDKPAIYADDEEAIALIEAIGADPAVILAP